MRKEIPAVLILPLTRRLFDRTERYSAWAALALSGDTRCGVPQTEVFGTPQWTVIGTADPAFDPALVEEVSTVEETEALVAAGADHGLDIAGDVVGSIQAVASVE